MTPAKRSSRRAGGRPLPRSSSNTSADPVKATSTKVATAIVFFVLLAFVLIPVLRLLVVGYRWALS